MLFQNAAHCPGKDCLQLSECEQREDLLSGEISSYDAAQEGLCPRTRFCLRKAWLERPDMPFFVGSQPISEAFWLLTISPLCNPLKSI